MSRQVRCKGTRIRVVGEMSVYTAVALHGQLLDAITERATSRALDLSEVTEMDTAGFQILLLARRKAMGLGRPLEIVAMSPPVSDVLELLQVDAGPGATAEESQP